VSVTVVGRGGGAPGSTHHTIEYTIIQRVRQELKWKPGWATIFKKNVNLADMRITRHPSWREMVTISRFWQEQHQPQEDGRYEAPQRDVFRLFLELGQLPVQLAVPQ
jgi:hypothetical protein